jgi:hypothetical protein
MNILYLDLELRLTIRSFPGPCVIVPLDRVTVTVVRLPCFERKSIDGATPLNVQTHKNVVYNPLAKLTLLTLNKVKLH